MVTASGAPTASTAPTARQVAETVTDPELPVLTLADLGVLREVTERPDGLVVVAITPTYTGCPAIEAMRDDLRARLAEEGFTRVEIRTVLDPPWTSDWISAAGREKLRAAGIAPPSPAPPSGGPVNLGPIHRLVRCPRCGSADTVTLSAFGSTACKSLHRCHACGEPFERVKEI
ncbi:1,2-phenylacetyl-CoA epoxidase subunit PaaD [Spongiactinospora sp. TRM90649]|uniref:1,2-phenylacetyl-CoA epoxidase subunit PaaD n=1 Tax=Spongiactinospora sp. TRM90649 TaxID=3031114 RepID=UPI0023F9DFB3|nr:1,2-phenylacetyl-CoA epoxidase subunit PaaD [Spongiactinospora sp. TRM90649]MDF5753588.1 phenylacetate-CoA oxygenase subunit PaaJ [Spongiactinospora sp. TRM90649]